LKNSFPRQQQLGSSARPANPPIAIVVRRFTTIVRHFENVFRTRVPPELEWQFFLKKGRANDPNVPNPAYVGGHGT
jgi:hypothetical protein